MNIERLRTLADKEEVDYQFLLSMLSDYAHPRDKITRWIKMGELIRVKKGLYVFGKHGALNAYSKEVLANLIYGPSAISLSYALSFYGMIPERVSTVTSITNQRKKAFTTPIGDFSYHYLNARKFSIGVELMNAAKSNAFLIASKEKALCDHVHIIDKKIKFADLEAVESYLLRDLRIDETMLRSLRTTHLTELCNHYNDSRLDLLIAFIKKWKKH